MPQDYRDAKTRGGHTVERLVQVQVVQGELGMFNLIGLDKQGQVWYGEVLGAAAPARYSVKWSEVEERSK